MKVQKSRFLFKAKDYLVSGEAFDVFWDDEKSIGWTAFPKEKKLEHYYESSAYDSHKKKRGGTIGLFYTTAQKIMFGLKWKLLKKRMNESASLLDFGAGSGDFMAFVKAKKVAVQGIEVNVKARAICVNKKLEVFDSLNLTEKQFTAITLWHVLEHLKNPLETLKSLYKRLEPNGVLLVAVPNIYSKDAKRYGSDWAALDVPRHLWHFSPEGLKRMTQAAGFSFIKQRPMWFDAFYVSYLSEKHKSHKWPFLRGCMVGLWSNFLAIFTKQASSMVYVFEKKISV